MPSESDPSFIPVIVTTKAALTAAVSEAVTKAMRRSELDAPPRPDQSLGWVTNKEAMRLLGLSKPTLARYRAGGTLPYSKVGSSVYYRLADIDALLAARAVGPSR